MTVRAAPTITSLAPTSLPRAAAAPTSFTLTGTNFAAGATVATKPDDPNVKITNVAFVNATTITFKASAKQAAALGTYKLQVKNTDGGSATCNCLIVVGPKITSVAPPTIKRGVATPITINGTGSTPVRRSSLRLRSLGNEPSPNHHHHDGHPLTARRHSARTSSSSPTRTARPTSARAACRSRVPDITAITPNSVARGTSASLTVTGTGFVPSVRRPTSPSCTFSTTAVTDSHTITTQITCPSNAPTGKFGSTSTVTNPDGGLGSFNGFTIT